MRDPNVDLFGSMVGRCLDYMQMRDQYSNNNRFYAIVHRALVGTPTPSILEESSRLTLCANKRRACYAFWYV